jgi:hypothetical protein
MRLQHGLPRLSDIKKSKPTAAKIMGRKIRRFEITDERTELLAAT